MDKLRFMAALITVSKPTQAMRRAMAETGLKLDHPPEEVDADIVFAEIPAELMEADEFIQGLSAEGVVVNPTHRNISADDVEAAGVRCGGCWLGSGDREPGTWRRP